MEYVASGPAGAYGGGIVFIAGNNIDFPGSITSNGGNGTLSWYGHYAGSGAGGSIRIEGYDVTLGALSVNGGTTAYGGGLGRIAIYYDNSTNITSNGYTFTQNVDPNATLTPTLTATPTGATPTATATKTATSTPTTIPAGWQERTYTYSETIPHAVTSVAYDEEENTYTYDANGNMTCRMEDGEWFIQTYNAENRIASIQKLAEGTCEDVVKLSMQWDFVYDGDGTRTTTLTTPYDEAGLPGTPTLTAYYFGGAYEVTGSDVKKYYSFGGQSILRDEDGLQYLLSDHLGSTVVVTNASGVLISEQRYLPFGQARSDVGSITQTDFGYTGQRSLDSGMGGLMDYKARFYSPALGRFVQPDSIIPNPGNPQAFNRFSYTANNPINYNDPTGHDWEDCAEGMGDYLCKQHKKRVAGILNKNTPPPPPPLYPGCVGSARTAACLTGGTNWHNSLISGGISKPGNSSLFASGYGGANTNAAWNPLSSVNWGGSTNPITLFQAFSPFMSIRIKSQYAATYSNGRPVTIYMSPSGFTSVADYLQLNNGFSANVTTDGTAGTTQSMLGDSLNGMFNTSSGFDFNPHTNQLSANVSVAYGPWSATQAMSLEVNINPGAGVVTGGAIAGAAVIIGIALIPGPVDDGVVVGGAYATFRLCQALGVCK